MPIPIQGSDHHLESKRWSTSRCRAAHLHRRSAGHNGRILERISVGSRVHSKACRISRRNLDGQFQYYRLYNADVQDDRNDRGQWWATWEKKHTTKWDDWFEPMIRRRGAQRKITQEWHLSTDQRPTGVSARIGVGQTERDREKIWGSMRSFSKKYYLSDNWLLASVTQRIGMCIGRCLVWCLNKWLAIIHCPVWTTNVPRREVWS